MTPKLLDWCSRNPAARKVSMVFVVLKENGNHGKKPKKTLNTLMMHECQVLGM